MIYDVQFTDSSRNRGNITRFFSYKDEIFEWAQENELTVHSIRPNWPKTILYYVYKILFPNREYGTLSDRELLALLKLLRTVFKYETDERKRRVIFENYAKNDRRYKNLAPVLKRISEGLDNGIPVHRILSVVGVPRFIPKALEVGRRSAKDVEIYERLIDVVGTRYEATKSVGKMLVYPKIVISFLYVYFLVAIFFQVPQTKKIIGFLDPTSFPEITKTFYAWSDYAMAHPAKFVIISLLILVGTYKLSYRAIASVLRYVPYLKDIWLARDYTIFSALMSVSLSANISLPESIMLSAEAISDKKLRKRFEHTALLISDKGIRFTKALEMNGFNKGNYFDLDFYNMVFAMEDTSELEKGMAELYEDYKERMTDVIEVAKNFVNPLMYVVILGGMIVIFYAINAPLNTIGKKGFRG